MRMSNTSAHCMLLPYVTAASGRECLSSISQISKQEHANCTIEHPLNRKHFLLCRKVKLQHNQWCTDIVLQQDGDIVRFATWKNRDVDRLAFFTLLWKFVQVFKVGSLYCVRSDNTGSKKQSRYLHRLAGPFPPFLNLSNLEPCVQIGSWSGRRHKCQLSVKKIVSCHTHCLCGVTVLWPRNMNAETETDTKGQMDRKKER